MTDRQTQYEEDGSTMPDELPSLSEARRIARAHGCEVVTQEFLDAVAEDNHRIGQVFRENAALKRKLSNRAWWRWWRRV